MGRRNKIAKKKRQVLPEKVKKDVVYYTRKHGNPEARICASKNYPDYSFEREAVRDWKVKYQKAFESNKEVNFFVLPRQGRPSKMSDELTTEVKSILHNLRVSGGAVTQKNVIAIGNWVLKARYSEMLEENGGSITLTAEWARGVLKSLDWVKRRYTTARREMNPGLHNELTFSWKRKIANAHFEHEIHKEMTFDFDQTALGFTAPNKFTFMGKGFILHPSQMLTINVKLQLLSALTLLVISYRCS